MAITEQQKNFCREYLKDYVVTKAMMRAGYSRKTALKNCTLMMNNPEVAAHLSELAQEAAKNTDITPEKVLAGLAEVAFPPAVTDYFKYIADKKLPVMKPIDEWTPKMKAAVSEYKPGHYIKFYDRISGLDKLGKHFKLYTDIDATTNNLFLLPPVTYNGQEVVFKIGKPAPKVTAKSG